MALVAGMLAGVLLRFGLDVFVAMNSQLVLALAMFATWLAGRRLFPRYAVIATLLVGIAVAAAVTCCTHSRQRSWRCRNG